MRTGVNKMCGVWATVCTVYGVWTVRPVVLVWSYG